MKFKQAFALALKSLNGSKMRSFLTMLGIIIGVAAVIILVSLMDGMTNMVTGAVEDAGANLISVTIMGRGDSNRTVDPNDMQILLNERGDSIGYFSPTVNIMGGTVKFENKNITCTVTGVNESYDEVRNVKVVGGRFLEYVDIARMGNVCVIGQRAINELFAGGDPLGQKLKISGQTFTVVGITESKQNGAQGSADDTIYIPYTVASKINSNSRVTSYSFSAKNKETIDQAVRDINMYLSQKFNGDTDAFTVFNMADALDAFNDVIGTMEMVLVGIAGISLLVGGIGIMNIMLVSVTERTKEIGIRKSLGAKQRDIMSQFVVEAATTSSVGGILGIVLGAVAAIGMGTLLGMTVVPSPNAVLLAFSVSAAIGIAFGYFPARKAARLNPIEALRFD